MALLTEIDAKTKWCPFARYAGYGTGDNRDSEGHPWETCMCIASACMAWRWQPSASMDNPTRFAGAGIQEIKRERGYCGLAGALP